MIKRFPIRSKLAAALAVPLLLLVSVAYVEVDKASANVASVREEAALAVTTVGPGGITLALQNERNLSATDMLGQMETMNLTVATVAEARAETDEKLEAFGKALADGPDSTERLYDTAFTKLRDLKSIRAEFDAYTGEKVLSNFQVSTEVFTAYSEVITAVLDANSQVPLLISDAKLRTAAQMLDQVSRQSNTIGELTRAIVFSILQNDKEPATLSNINDLAAKYDIYRESFPDLAQPEYKLSIDRFLKNPRYVDYRAMVTQFQTDDGPLDIARLLTLPTQNTGNNNFEALRQDTVKFVNDRADKLVTDAENEQRNFTLLAVLGLLAALLITGIAARSITRPLRQLTVQTEEMATRRLPEAVQSILDTPLGEDVKVPELPPIKVRTRDEVADVALALNTVQNRTLDLAVEQAVLRRNIADSFVNLGRRTQNLISRQLDFITTLENDEQDPEALEDLFKLDHLATRVRRNAESLVVLAGLESTQQWSAPVAVEDIVRAALGEVEEYQRVEITEIEPGLVPGASASDLVHLMAELIENGLSFSPPYRDVEVLGRMTNHGYLFAIIDQGIGMNAEELDRANQRLAGEESFTIAPSRYLGHYVTGHLAARTGVDVALQSSPAGGVTAKVIIPKTVLVSEELAQEPPAAPEPAPVALASVKESPVEESPEVEAHTLHTDGPPPAAPAPEAAPIPVATPEPATAPEPVVTPVAAEPKVEAPAPVLALHGNGSSKSGDIQLKSSGNGRSAPKATPKATPRSTAKTTSKTTAKSDVTSGSAAPAGTTEAGDVTGGLTANGLSKRVKGVQMPNTTGVVLNRKAAKDDAVVPADESDKSGNVFDFLSSFDSGATKAREDADQATASDTTTDTNKNEG